MVENDWEAYVPDTLQCPGCQAAIDVTRPPDVGLSLDRGNTEDGRPTVTIMLGRVEVHRCQMFPDGAWR
ncbi:MAG: hypothetical protein WEC34_11235 [Acidimicrobiia bacterium]